MSTTKCQQLVGTRSVTKQNLGLHVEGGRLYTHTLRLYMLQMCNGVKQTSRRELGFARGDGNCYLLLGARVGPFCQKTWRKRGSRINSVLGKVVQWEREGPDTRVKGTARGMRLKRGRQCRWTHDSCVEMSSTYSAFWWTRVCLLNSWEKIKFWHSINTNVVWAWVSPLIASSSFLIFN